MQVVWFTVRICHPFVHSAKHFPGNTTRQLLFVCHFVLNYDSPFSTLTSQIH